MSADLNPDGPHSPETTRKAAELASSAIQFLAYATRQGSGGLAGPSDAYDLLRVLAEMAGRLWQPLDQVMAFLAGQHSAGLLGCDDDGDVTEAVLRADLAISAARERADLLGVELRAAQNAVAGLHGKEPAG